LEETKKELESYKGRAESEGDERQRQISTKDNEIRTLRAEVQRINQLLASQKDEYTSKLTNKNLELESKDSEIDQLLRDAEFKGNQSETQFKSIQLQLTREKDQRKQVEDHLYHLQQQNDKFQQDIQELRSSLSQATQKYVNLFIRICTYIRGTKSASIGIAPFSRSIYSMLNQNLIVLHYNDKSKVHPAIATGM